MDSRTRHIQRSAPNGNRVSVILSTLGRVDIGPLLASLAKQTSPIFEVVVIEQGSGPAVATACAEYSSTLNITHYRSAERGASRGRNAGIARSRGDLLLFADDDASYDKDFVSTCVEVLLDGYGFVSGICYVPGTRERRRHPIRDVPSHDINPSNLLTSAMEATLIIRRDALPTGGFNECLGVGSGTPAGSDEGADLLMRMLKSGVKGRFVRRAVIYHPDKVAIANAAAVSRAYSYSVGRGYTLRKYWFGWRVLTRELIRPIIGAVLYAVRGDTHRAAYYFAVTRGKLRGLTLDLNDYHHDDA